MFCSVVSCPYETIETFRVNLAKVLLSTEYNMLPNFEKQERERRDIQEPDHKVVPFPGQA